MCSRRAVYFYEFITGMDYEQRYNLLVLYANLQLELALCPDALGSQALCSCSDMTYDKEVKQAEGFTWRHFFRLVNDSSAKA